MNKSRTFYTLFMVLVMVPGFFSYTFAQRKKTKKEKNESTVSMEVHYDAERIRFTNMLGDALTLKTIDDIDNALKKLNECYKIWPDNQVINYELASIYIYKKKYDIALPYIEKAVKGDPKNKWYLIDYIEVLIRLDKFKETEKAFKDLISLEPDNIDYISEFAELYMSEKKYKEAIALFEDIETKTGVHPEISLQKQKLYKAMGKTQASLDEIQKLIKAFPLEAQYYGILAETYLEMKKKDEALNAYLKVLELEPDNSIIHLALANFYQEKGDHEKAFEHIKLAFQNPDVDIDDKIKVLLSYYQISDNNQIRKEQAYTLIQLLIDTHPNDPKSWAIKGDFLIRDNRYDQAIDVFEKVNQLDKGRYPVWEQLLSLYYNKKDWPMLTERSREANDLVRRTDRGLVLPGIGCPIVRAIEETVRVTEHSY
ncbi:MAG: tetratricopeptide repeat protein, partial [Flavobacteriales bacterium]|nr:tetratricopeptide repeat protein [Flavobacteriales bacterium]